jgi:multidrug efflux system outer membrane protein
MDVMGQNTLNWRASRHEAQAAEGSQQAQTLALATMTAEAYYDVVAARETSALIKQQLKNQQDLLDLVEFSFQKGAARSTDVLQQRQQFAAAQARLPAARQGELLATEGLRRLIGGAPPVVGDSFPKLGEAPPLGDAAGLLQSRPDLAAAANILEAARLQKLAATRSYGPSVALNGQLGWQYYQFTEFDSTKTWGVGASATLPVFSGGRITSGIRAAKANEVVAANDLRGTALTVLQEVRTASVGDTTSAEQLTAVLRQQEAAHAAYNEARAQYQRGVISYIQALPILIASQGADLAAIDARRQRLSARIQLHDALGGTWPTNRSSHGVKP